MYHCRAKEKFFITAIARLLPMLAILAAFTAGCKCTAISNHEWAGHFPPKLNSPEAIAEHIKHSVIGRVKHAGVAGRFTIPFKRMGIFGWSDLGYDGEVTGIVKQTAKSTDQFFTVDIQLETLQIDGRNMPFDDQRFLRAEICLCEVNWDIKDRPVASDRVWIRGRMVWDGDGFVEIHPRSEAEVKKLPNPPQ